ncbi:hypothetical protein D9M69_719080 [compost metagenome]
MARMLGLICSRRPENICRGMVRCCGPAMNRMTTTSSKEVMKANSAPEITPGRISGMMMSKNTRNGVAPRFSAARARL